MITGKVMYDIEISVADEKELNKLGAAIRLSLKQIKGVIDSEEIDSELDETDDSIE